MSIDSDLHTRAGSKCELCGSNDDLGTFNVPHARDSNADTSILICKTCIDQIEKREDLNPPHWRCLNDAMWSEVRGVQVIAWHMLKRLESEPWARDLSDMLYLDDDMLAWATAVNAGALGADDVDGNTSAVKHLDSNGAILAAGDTVTLIKDLTVKGAGFTAKRGTAVRNISLVPDNDEHIEGRVSGQQIVILTKFVKKMK